jgi:hypothetical protein
MSACHRQRCRQTETTPERRTETEIREVHMNIKEEMEKRGAATVQMESKTLAMVEDILAEASDDEIKDAGMNAVRGIYDQICEANRKAASIRASLAYEVEKAEDKIRRAEAAAKISPETAQGICMFESIIHAVKDCFGEENMTEEIMCKAIEAGSYGVWRGIMGESKPLVAKSGKIY